MNYLLKRLFFQFSMEFERRFFQLCRNFSTKLSKTHFTCPQEHFYKNTMLILCSNFRLWARKCRICGGKFAGLLSNEHYLFPNGQSEEYFCKKLNFFRMSRELFLVCSLNQFRNGCQNCIFHARKNIPIKKNILTKLFIIIFGLWGNFS